MDALEIDRIKAGMQYESTRGGPPDDFPELPEIPAGRYVDPEFYELERQALWRRSWVYAIHADEVPEIGSYLKWDRLGDPLFFVRGDDNKIRCFYNTCRHRGAPVVTEEKGKGRGMVCGYHGWTYNLKGDLINLRDKRDFVGLDLKCKSLIEVRCENFGNWHFINMDKNAGPLMEYLAPVVPDLSEFQPQNLRLADRHGVVVECNVKVLLDAFLEVYHLKSIHQNTVDRFLDHRGSFMTLWPGGHSRMVTPNRRPGWQDPGTKGLPDIPTVGEIARTANVSINVYPNIVVPPAPTGMPFIVFWPIDIRRMYIEVCWFSPDWGDGPRPEIWETRISNFDRILEEDTQFADSIQKSVESGGFTGISLNYQERRIYHWHEELDRRIGDAVPDHLRVAQVLGKFIEAVKAA